MGSEEISVDIQYHRRLLMLITCTLSLKMQSSNMQFSRRFTIIPRLIKCTVLAKSGHHQLLLLSVHHLIQVWPDALFSFSTHHYS